MAAAVLEAEAVDHRRVVRRPRGASLTDEVGEQEYTVGAGRYGARFDGEPAEAFGRREFRVQRRPRPGEGEPAVVDGAADEPAAFVEDVAPRAFARVEPRTGPELADGAALPTVMTAWPAVEMPVPMFAIPPSLPPAD